MVTGIAGDSSIPAASGSLGGWRDQEDGGTGGAPRLGLRVYAREVSPSVTLGGQICRLGVGSACGEPGTEHSRGQILGQDPCLHPWAPHLRTTQKPSLQLPVSPARLPDLPPHRLQPPPKRFPGDTHLHQPGPPPSSTGTLSPAPPMAAGCYPSARLPQSQQARGAAHPPQSHSSPVYPVHSCVCPSRRVREARRRPLGYLPSAWLPDSAASHRSWPRRRGTSRDKRGIEAAGRLRPPSSWLMRPPGTCPAPG